jgi:hypothetical protein
MIPVEAGDNNVFIDAVEKICNATIENNKSKELMIVRIDNWFGSRWLDFSGKIMGLAGVCKERRTVPPFVPARVVWQRRFSCEIYEEINAGKQLHIDVTGGKSLTRYLDLIEPGALLVWFSGGTAENKRGSVMVYVPSQEGYFTCYASFAAGDDLQVVECHGITVSELASVLTPESGEEVWINA